MTASTADQAAPLTHDSLLTRSDWLLIAALVALVLPLRVWLLCNTEVTARDSIGYIRYALEFERMDWKEVLKKNHQHPGYPLMVLAMSQPIRAIDGAKTPENMELSTQLVNLIASLLLILPMYFLGRQFFDRTISFGAVLLYQFLPISAQHLSDGISEPIYLLLLVSGLLQMVHAVRERSVWRCQLCGLFTGLAYLTRPEGALVLPAFLGVLTALQLRATWRCPWRQFFECATSAAITAALVGAPYYIATGHFSNKPTVLVIVEQEKVSQVRDPLAGPQLFAAAIPKTDSQAALLARSGYALCSEVNYGFHYIAGVPALLGFIWSFGSLRRNAGFWALLLYAGLHCVILIRLGTVANYISDRHVMVLVLGGCYYAVAGLRELPRRLLTWRVQDTDTMASRTRIAAVVCAVMFLALIGFCLPKATQRLHGNRAANHEAGVWLRSAFKSGDHVEDDHAWADFFSGGVFREAHTAPVLPAGSQPTCWVVMTRSKDAEIGAARQQKVLNEYARPVQWWPEGSDFDQARVVIYAQPRDRVKNPWTEAKGP